MPYVQRNDQGVITGVYNNLQEGYAEEWLVDDDPEVLNYFTPPPTDAQLWSAYQRQAAALIASNDIVAIRCVKANVPYPAEWFSCDVALRAILHATSGDHTIPLPAQPITRPIGT